jgi:hypothetical protein
VGILNSGLVQLGRREKHLNPLTDYKKDWPQPESNWKANKSSLHPSRIEVSSIFQRVNLRSDDTFCRIFASFGDENISNEQTLCVDWASV